MPSHQLSRRRRWIRVAMVCLVLAAGCQFGPPADEQPEDDGRGDQPSVTPDGDGDDDAPGSDAPADEQDPSVLVITAAALDAGREPAGMSHSVASSELDLADDGDGALALYAIYDGSGDNGYARVQVPVRWREGDEVRYGMRVLLPSGFLDAQKGAVDLIRWDNWVDDPDHTDHGGLALGSDGSLRLIAEQRGVQGYRALTSGVDVPEDQWVELVVRQRLSSSDGDARNEIWLDGQLLAESTSANTSGRTIRTLRAGIVSIDAGAQRRQLELWFDDVVVEPISRSAG